MPSGSYVDNSVISPGQNNTLKGASMLKLKRAFAGRRKNNSQDFDIPSVPSTPSHDPGATPRAGSPRPSGGKFAVFTRKGLHSQSQLALDETDTGVPPPPPPKEHHREPRGFSQSPQPARPTEFGQVQDIEEREDWRKSNSTTHTVRPQVATHPQTKRERERDLSPHSLSSHSPSSMSSQLPSPGSSHTSMSAYQSQPHPPERRPTKRSFTSGLLPESLKTRRAMAQTTGASAVQAVPPTSFRHQTPSPPLNQAYTPWPRMHVSTDHEPARQQQLQPNDQQRQNSLSFTNTTLQLGKRAVGKMNFRGWGSSIARASSPAAQSSNSSTSSLVHSGGSDGHSKGHKGKSHPQAHGTDGKRGNHSVHSFASGSGNSEVEFPQLPTLSGPQLGIMLRGPLITSNYGGLVFGRDLASATRETRIASMTLADYNPAEPRELEKRMMPALIVRCVIHLRKWGLDEEGLFRISGRQTHIQRLRAEFDIGADWDMSDCSPAELDPHAVASVLRAYLRALPEPILTRALGSQFEAAMSLEEFVSEQNSSPVGAGGRGGPALPLSPKSRPQIIRQPSVRDSSPGGPRGPSRSLINSVSHLIAQLPVEHHDVLQSITEIIRETAKNSKATKMPMSNLLLIFCPSLNMPPALLRLLCQSEEVWTPPPAVPRLTRQRSASESVVLLSRKSACTPASQSSENLSTPSSPFESSLNEESVANVPGSPVDQAVTAEPGDASSIPLPSPANTGLEDMSKAPEEHDELFERESRRHTLIAPLPALEDTSWTIVEESPPGTGSSSPSVQLSPAPLVEASCSQHSVAQMEGYLGTRDAATREHELIMSMKQLSESETELQRSHSILLGDSFEQATPLRHVVSLNLLRTKNLSEDLNGPPSARSLPLEGRPSIRRRVSSRLRFSFRRKSTDLDGLAGESFQSPLEPPVESSPDTPPQLAPLLFDSLSLDPDGVEGGLPLNIRRLSINPTSKRLSLHIRSRSTPALKELPINLSPTQEGKTADRRTSITGDHNLLVLPPLRSSPLYSPAPMLDITPEQSDDDWLQSVLKAAASGGS